MNSLIAAEIIGAVTAIGLTLLFYFQMRQNRMVMEQQRELWQRQQVTSKDTQLLLDKLQESVNSLRSFLPRFDVNPGLLERATADLRKAIQNLDEQRAAMTSATGTEVRISDYGTATDELHVDKGIARDVSDQGVITDELRVYENVAVQYRHSIKTPLSSIVSSIENMQTYLDMLGPSGNPSSDEARGIVASSLDLAQLSIESIRDILSHGAGFLPGAAGPVDIAEVVKRAERITRSYAQSSAALTVQLEDMDTITSYSANIQVAMIQLLENAFEAVKDSGHITVRGQSGADQKEITVIVSNDGPAIPPQVAAKLFDVPISTKGPNRGTGLIVARQCMEAIKGGVELVGSNGKLTEFRLRIKEAA